MGIVTNKNMVRPTWVRLKVLHVFGKIVWDLDMGDIRLKISHYFLKIG